MEKKQRNKIVTMGFALFAMFFGAGNVIFPPYLARQSGTEWPVAFIGFLITDIGLGLLAIWVVVANKEGTIFGVVNKLGKIPSKIFLSLILLGIGPALIAPRTATTTYEMGISILFPQLRQWMFGLAFFIVVLLATLRPNKVVDIVGNILTPILLIVLIILIVIGAISPLGEITTDPKVVPFKEGLISGYQTMDALGALFLAGLTAASASNSGYTDKGTICKMVGEAGLLAAFLLVLIYGGLSHLGATTCGLEQFNGLDQAGLIMQIVQSLMGGKGVVLLTLIILLACLTTAIGVTSMVADNFSRMSNGKLKYSHLVIACVVVSYVISNFGLTTIISVAAPILGILYAPTIVLIVTALFEKPLNNDNIGRLGAYIAFVVSFMEYMCTFGLPFDFIGKLPMVLVGFVQQ